jgi:hypothetical protein
VKIKQSVHRCPMLKHEVMEAAITKTSTVALTVNKIHTASHKDNLPKKSWYSSCVLLRNLGWSRACFNLQGLPSPNSSFYRYLGFSSASVP